MSHCFFRERTASLPHPDFSCATHKKQPQGVRGSSIPFSMRSLARSARFAPMHNLKKSHGHTGTASPSPQNGFTHSRTVEITVPVAEESLLVAMALCMGTIKKIRRQEIKPPPPATESTKLARNTIGHTVRNACMVSSILFFPPAPLQVPAPGSCASLTRLGDCVKSELLCGLLFGKAKHLKHFLLHIVLVNTNASSSDLSAVQGRYKLLHELRPDRCPEAADPRPSAW